MRAEESRATSMRLMHPSLVQSMKHFETRSSTPQGKQEREIVRFSFSSHTTADIRESVKHSHRVGT